ncbi:MAG: hypothetical protein WCG84_03670 [Candidatus Moraniibacteriota bacterium]
MCGMNPLMLILIGMSKVMRDKEFWDVLRTGAEKRHDIVYSKGSDFESFAVHLEHAEIGTFKNYFGSSITTRNIRQQESREQLFKKLALGDYDLGKSSVSVPLEDLAYGEILMKFSSYSGNDKAFRVHFLRA